MRLSIRRSILGCAALASLIASVAVAPTAGAATPGHARRIGTQNFADPGFGHFAGRYYVYATGTGFPVRSSASPQSGYGKIARSMPARPAWVDASDPLLWAPNVYATTSNGKALYVMYFTGQSKAYGIHCIGIATSSRPGADFVAQRAPAVCSPLRTKGYEAIDPTGYRTLNGTRYLIFKSDYRNASGFDIRAVRMNSTGTSVRGTSFSLLASSTRMEAPSVLYHAGRVYLFTSRGDYTNCTYSTDVWSAKDFSGDTYRRIGTVMSQASTGLCGPGGATVIQDGSITRIAFHAYSNAAHNGPRQAWVGQLRWNSAGHPYLY